MNPSRLNCLQRSPKPSVFDSYQVITSVNNCLPPDCCVPTARMASSFQVNFRACFGAVLWTCPSWSTLSGCSILRFFLKHLINIHKVGFALKIVRQIAHFFPARMNDILQSRRSDQLLLYFLRAVFSQTNSVLSMWPTAPGGARCIGVMLMNGEEEVCIPSANTAEC